MTELDPSQAFDRSAEAVIETSALVLAGQLLDAAGFHKLGQLIFGTSIIMEIPAVTALVVNLNQGEPEQFQSTR